MIRDRSRVEELERRYEREALGDLSYEEALRRFASLWAEAFLLNPELGSEGAGWEDDLAADLRVARVLNGLSTRT